MIVLSAHKVGGYKTTNDTLARSRQIAYVCQPRNLINRILDSCIICKIKGEKTASQRVDKLLVSWVSSFLTFSKCIYRFSRALYSKCNYKFTNSNQNWDTYVIVLCLKGLTY